MDKKNSTYTKYNDYITLREGRNIKTLQSSCKRLTNGLIKVFLSIIPKYGNESISKVFSVNPQKATDYMVNNKNGHITLKPNHPNSKKNK